MSHEVRTQFGDREIIIETGKMAKQAGGSVTIRCGDTIVLVAATASASAKEGIDFLPLTVEYLEKTFSTGKIPGGFFKREGRPTDQAVLVSRFIDRPIRPLFPEHYYFDTQVIAMVISAEPNNIPDVLALTAASTALMISDIPFSKPVAGCRVARINGKLVLNPGLIELDDCDMELVVAATEDAVCMVEGNCDEVSEDDLLKAIEFAHASLKPLIRIQKELQAKVGKTKRVIKAPERNDGITAAVKAVGSDITAAFKISVKLDRYAKLKEIKDAVKAKVITVETPKIQVMQLDADFENLKSDIMRKAILDESRRIDGRGLKEIRPISCEVGVLPRAHGSALFTRGETQALVVATLGSSDDEQRIDALLEEKTKKFMLQYNFPSFSVGEVKPLRSPGRREIGHGNLAENALQKVLPNPESFPYTIRIVSEVLESNGSSSMATVCGGSLALMDAGCPIQSPVAGIAMGLIKEDTKVAILSDILGDEDHLGDMDFKVAGTRKGVTALQMDIKIEGVTSEIMANALKQANEGRLHILGKMEEGLTAPRAILSAYAPKIETLRVPVNRIKDVIGSGGKTIRSIIEETGVKMDVEDDGLIKIFGVDPIAIARAVELVRWNAAEPEVGKIYRGVVKRILDFGAFVEILPKTDGLLHISMISEKRLERVTDVLQEGDRVYVKLVEIDPGSAKMRLSMKDVPQEPAPGDKP